MASGTTSLSVMQNYGRALQGFEELYVWWSGLYQGEDLTDQELYERALLAASKDDPTVSPFASRFLFAHRRLRDSIAELGSVLDMMSGLPDVAG